MRLPGWTVRPRRSGAGLRAARSRGGAQPDRRPARSPRPTQAPPRWDVGLVGPCAAGKTTVAQGLQALGWRAKAIAQEHSFVPDMWQRLTRPRVLVFLDVSWAEARRRKALRLSPEAYAEQQQRLAHARAHADLVLPTDGLSPAQTIARVDAFLRTRLGSPAAPEGRSP